jgi:ankyrin repeat protein
MKNIKIKGKLISSDDVVGILKNALLKGDVRSVEFLIKKGVPVNVKDYRGETPLHNAAAYGEKEVVEVLLKAGADVNVQNSRFETPLYISVRSGNKEVVEILLKSGAYIDHRCSSQLGVSALKVAIKNGNVEICRLLIENGADVGDGAVFDRPIEIAASCGNLEVVEELLKSEIFHNVTISSMSSLAIAVIVAYRSRHRKIFDILKKRCDKVFSEMEEFCQMGRGILKNYKKIIKQKED